MVRYLSLIRFTDQGIREAKDSIHRAESFRSAVAQADGKVKDLYWAVGELDGAVIFEVPDEETAASLLLNLGQQGFVRTQSARIIYDSDEFEKIITKR